MRLLLVGVSHHTAPLELRERFAVRDPEPLLAKLVASDEIDEAFLLSTCNRVEALVATQDEEAARHRLRRLFRREIAGDVMTQGLDPDAVFYEHADIDAVRHVFRVCSSLDSMVVGEPQIARQMKDAYETAVSCRACGPILSRLLQSAFSASKRVRRDTRIGERPVSVARVAVDLARQIFEEFNDKTALLVGAGEMIETALEALRGEGLASVHVANRTPAHATTLAARFGAAAHGLDAIPALLARVDVVLTSIGVDAPIIDLAIATEAQSTRRGRPLFVIDIGVPRNVDPDVNRLDGVYLYDIDDLASVAAANAEERRREKTLGESIVLEEQQRFAGWLLALQAVPTIRHLRSRAEAIRSGELERAIAKLGFDEAQRAGVDALTRAIVNKLLHAPISRLREGGEREDGLVYLEAARVLFALDDPEAPGAAAARAAQDGVQSIDSADDHRGEDETGGGTA